MSKFVVIVGIIVIVIFAFYSFWSKTKTSLNLPSPTPVSSLQADPIKVDELKQGGSSYSDPNGVYVFLYPSEYKLDTQNNGEVVRIYKVGPTQKGQTEIYDGVVMTFEKQNLNGKGLENWTSDYIKSLTNGDTIELIKDKEKTQVNGQVAYTFVLRGLGEHQYYSISKTNSDFVIISASNVSDPGNLGFQKEVDAILTTLEIIK